MCTCTSSEIRKLFTKASNEALTPAEQQNLSTSLEADPKLVYQIGLTPQKVIILLSLAVSFPCVCVCV